MMANKIHSAALSLGRLHLSILCSCLICNALPALAQTEPMEECLRTEVLRAENGLKTVNELRADCATRNVGPDESPGFIPVMRSDTFLQGFPDTRQNTFFQPYKRNYITFGSMENADGGEPFSGQALDIKFELGMKFTLFPQIEELRWLTPLKFGYSQRSWWDIAESSAPFTEHNYNPEIFWDFTESLARPANRPRLHIVDVVGLEHQSNGLDGMDSRGWDRIYVQREFRLSEAWSWTFKYWHVVNLGDFNKDLEDFAGKGEITTHFDINNWMRIDLKTTQGRETSKINYQIDLIIPMTQWINSSFMLSYFNGFNEALISHDTKTSSLRAGFYFPLGF